MVSFKTWFEANVTKVGKHDLRVLTAIPEHLDEAQADFAIAVPNHYASPERIAEMLERLGKTAAATFLREKLPETSRIRSGDLGEIIATEYIDGETAYFAPIRRLRWKDHREMAMRGDDVIGVRQPKSKPIEFLKSEAKSRRTLASGVVNRARGALNSDFGLPSPHALAFVADRLKESGQLELADAIDDAQWRRGVSPKQVEHLLFTFSQNDPLELLQADLESYDGAIRQNNVGISLDNHQDFIAAVYELAANGDDN